MPKTIGIVQARMGSQRFPGKSLTPLWNDVTLVELVLTRVSRAAQLDDIVVATSDQPADDVLARFVEECGFRVFRGDEQDVTARFCEVARNVPCDAIVRICGDNPLIDSLEIDKLVRFFWANQPCEYACNDRLDCGLPDGSGAEIFSCGTLMRLNDEVPDDLREHVSLYITQNQSEFRVARLKAAGPLHRPEIRLDVDYEEDAVFIRRLISWLPAGDAPDWTTTQIIEALDRCADISTLRRTPNSATVLRQG